MLVRLADGELDALEELYDRYKTMAYSIAYRITNDPNLAEDVVQDAFLGAWRNAARYIEGRGSVKTWLLSIVHHRAIDTVRRRRPTTELPDVELPLPTALTLPDVWAEVVAVLDAETVRVAMSALSDVQREAIELTSPRAAMPTRRSSSSAASCRSSPPRGSSAVTGSRSRSATSRSGAVARPRSRRPALRARTASSWH